MQWTVEDGYPTLAALASAIKTGKNAFRITHDDKTLWELLKVRALPKSSTCPRIAGLVQKVQIPYRL